ncbi:MAG TPA: hypothetical protein VD886_05440 [Herpetosiphonaceae bacterium]|nr:hypothetical protein [Herpetosiphonaceae bacterium]
MGEPDWGLRVISNLPGMSQVELVFDAAADPPFSQFHGMHDVMIMPPAQAATYPRLPQLPLRMQRIGIVGSSVPRRQSAGGPALPHPWTLAFTWPVKRPAWDTFLATQDQHRPQRLALMPPMLIPLTYLTRMADLLAEPFDTTMVCWLAHANGSQRRLDALISSLFSVWMRGTSQAAAHYRTLVPQAATGSLPPREQRALHALDRAFGPGHQRQVSAAERPEPTILRLLHTLSEQLWTAAGLPLPDLPTTLLQGLLPLALWGRPDDPAAPPIPPTAAGLARLWQAGTPPRTRGEVRTGPRTWELRVH